MNKTFWKTLDAFPDAYFMSFFQRHLLLYYLSKLFYIPSQKLLILTIVMFS